jgi:hypothetical protein
MENFLQRRCRKVEELTKYYGRRIVLEFAYIQHITRDTRSGCIRVHWDISGFTNLCKSQLRKALRYCCGETNDHKGNPRPESEWEWSYGLKDDIKEEELDFAIRYPNKAEWNIKGKEVNKLYFPKLRASWNTDRVVCRARSLTEQRQHRGGSPCVAIRSGAGPGIIPRSTRLPL